MRAQKIIGVSAIIVAVLSIPPSLISGVGLVGAVVSLLTAAVAGGMQGIKYAAIAGAITTINIFGLSVLTLSKGFANKEMFIFLGVPYLIFAFGLAVGIARNKGYWTRYPVSGA